MKTSKFIASMLILAAALFWGGVLNKAVAEEKEDEAAAGEKDVVVEDSGAAEEESEGFSLDLSTAVASDYVFRGQNYYNGTSIQPEVAGGYSFGKLGSLNASAWSHLSGESSEGSSEKFTEIDYTVNYDITFDMVTVSLGHVWYTYPNDDDDINNSAEIFAEISLDTVLSPTFSFYHDYDNLDCQYYELALSQNIETDALGKGFNVTPSVTLGFASNAEKVYDDQSGLMFVGLGLASDLALGDITVTPSLNYNFKVDDATTDEFWFSLTFGYSL